jgi:uncharacterized repeat protein (TIGR03847 family)
LSKRISYRHEPTESFIAGAVGEPGSREFFLQFQSVNGTNSVRLEKAQLIALVERFEELLREVKRSKLADINELTEPVEVSEGELVFPIQEDFIAGVMGITWEQDLGLISLEVQELSELEEFRDLVGIDVDTDIHDFPPEILQSVLRIDQVRSFIKQAQQIITAGREPCIFCGLPIDKSGHLCPRANGYKR